MNIKQRSDSILGVCCILTATFLLSVRGILVKQAYIANIAVMDLFFYRFLITIPLLWIFALYKHGSKQVVFSLKPQLINCILAGFFGYYLATLSDFYSLKLIDVSVNRIILYSFPIYVLIWNCFIERKLPKFKYIITFIIIQIGLFFVLGGLDNSLLIANKEGAILALIASISYSLYIVINQQTGKKIGSILFTCYAVSFSFIFITIHYFAFYDNSHNIISDKGWLIIIIMAIFCTFLPLLLISQGIKYIGATRMSLLSTSGPVMTAIFAFIILGESLTIMQILGGILVIIILFFMEKKK